VIVRDSCQLLGKALIQLTVHPECEGDNAVDKDIVIVWADSKRMRASGQLGNTPLPLMKTKPFESFGSTSPVTRGE
jgi:hypothetical protein